MKMPYTPVKSQLGPSPGFPLSAQGANSSKDQESFNDFVPDFATKILSLKPKVSCSHTISNGLEFSFGIRNLI